MAAPKYYDFHWDALNFTILIRFSFTHSLVRQFDFITRFEMSDGRVNAQNGHAHASLSAPLVFFVFKNKNIW